MKIKRKCPKCGTITYHNNLIENRRKCTKAKRSFQKEGLCFKCNEGVCETVNFLYGTKVYSIRSK